MSSTVPPPRNRQLWCRSAAKMGKPASSLSVGASDRVVELAPDLQRLGARATARWAGELQGDDVLARVGEERREGLDISHRVAPLGVREAPPPARHGAARQPFVDRVEQVGVGRQLSARRRPDLVDRTGEIARTWQHVRRRRAVARAAIAMATGAPLHVDGLPFRRVLYGDEERGTGDGWCDEHERQQCVNHAPSPVPRLPSPFSPRSSASTRFDRRGRG